MSIARPCIDLDDYGSRIAIFTALTYVQRHDEHTALDDVAGTDAPHRRGCHRHGPQERVTGEKYSRERAP